MCQTPAVNYIQLHPSLEYVFNENDKHLSHPSVLYVETQSGNTFIMKDNTRQHRYWAIMIVSLTAEELLCTTATETRARDEETTRARAEEERAGGEETLGGDWEETQRRGGAQEGRRGEEEGWPWAGECLFFASIGPVLQCLVKHISQCKQCVWSSREGLLFRERVRGKSSCHWLKSAIWGI